MTDEFRLFSYRTSATRHIYQISLMINPQFLGKNYGKIYHELGKISNCVIHQRNKAKTDVPDNSIRSKIHGGFGLFDAKH